MPVGNLQSRSSLLIEVRTNLSQQNENKGTSPFASLYSFEISEKNQYPPQDTIQKAGLFNEAQVTAEVAPGVDVDINVDVILTSFSRGCFAWSSLKFDNRNHYIQVPFVSVDYTPNPPPVVLEDYKHFPPKHFPPPFGLKV